MIYLASPYSHDDPNIVQERVDITTKVVNKLLQEGKTVVSPVVYGHNIVKTCGLPGDWGFWEKFCKEMISKSDEVLVLPLDGWEESIGVQGELEYADKLGIFVTIMNSEIFDEL